MPRSHVSPTWTLVVFCVFRFIELPEVVRSINLAFGLLSLWQSEQFLGYLGKVAAGHLLGSAKCTLVVIIFGSG